MLYIVNGIKEGDSEAVAVKAVSKMLLNDRMYFEKKLPSSRHWPIYIIIILKNDKGQR